MSKETKACNLTVEEIENLINSHGCNTGDNIGERLERMNYLNKRLKAFFDEPDKPDAQFAADAKPTAAGSSW